MVLTRKAWLWMLFVVVSFGAVFLIGGSQLPAEYQLSSEVIISRPPEKAWQWFVRPEHWADRFSIIQISDARFPPGQVGSMRHITFILPEGSKLESDVIITAWVKGKLYADRHIKDTINGKNVAVLNARSRFDFQPVGKNMTRLVFTGDFEVGGLLNRWDAFLVLRPLANDMISKSLSQLRQAIEEKGMSNHTIHVRFITLKPAN